KQTSYPSTSSAVSILLRLHTPLSPEFSTLSLHDALPICVLQHQIEIRHGAVGLALGAIRHGPVVDHQRVARIDPDRLAQVVDGRSEEHTSELQSQSNLVCRLLFEKKKVYATLHVLVEAYC